ncbi:MAG: HEAT repeat domain-containing protein [Planctomycetota bacterium]|nr:HEAT repeat domain-containing protein [Planctomycetota bacterium]
MGKRAHRLGPAALILAGLCLAAGVAHDAETRADGSLAQLLVKKADVLYRWDYLPEVLDDLKQRFGLHSACRGVQVAYGQMKPELGHLAPSEENNFTFTFEAQQVTIKEVLERLAAAGGLRSEYRGDTVVFWKKADDALLAQLEKELKSEDVQARCDAVCGLSRLSDLRIYPLLFKALSDPDPAVLAWSVKCLKVHAPMLPYGQGLDGAVETLVQYFHDPPPGHSREDFAALLGSSRHERAVEVLLAALRQQDEHKLRLTAAVALGTTRRASAFEPLAALLEGREYDLAAWGASALIEIDNTRATDLLVPLLPKWAAEKSGRVNYFGLLGRLRDPGAVDILVAVAQDKSVLQLPARYGLFSSRNPLAVLPLLKLLRERDMRDDEGRAFVGGFLAQRRLRDPAGLDLFLAYYQDAPANALNNGFVLYQGIETVRPVGGVRLLNWLAERLRSPEAHERRRAAYCLGRTRNPQAVEILVGYARSERDAETQREAVAALGSIPDASAVDALLSFAKDASPNLRRGAAAGLRDQDARTVEARMVLANDPDAEVRTAAIGATNNPRLVQAQVRCLKDPHEAVRKEAVAALGKAPDARVVAPLIALGADPEPAVRRAVAESLCGLGDPRARDAVLALLQDKDEEVRTGTAYEVFDCWLGRLPEPRMVETLVALLRDPEEGVRCAANCALQELGHGLPPARLSSFLERMIALLDDKDAGLREEVYYALRKGWLTRGSPYKQKLQPVLEKYRKEHPEEPEVAPTPAVKPPEPPGEF